MARVVTALTIAGSDSSGGAGIQADLKTFLALGVYGMSAITALTAQNTEGVQRIESVDPELLADQITAVASDLPIGAIKIGMLPSVDHVRVVAEVLRGLQELPPVVLDPVHVATTGAVLAGTDVLAAIVRELVPLAMLLTPNQPEARQLAGSAEPSRIHAWAKSLGCPVLLKGGHGSGDVTIDTLWLTADQARAWSAPRVDTLNTHGTGCTLSSAIAAHLAKGEDLQDAVGAGFQYVQELLRRAVGHGLGRGKGPLLHGASRLVAPADPSGLEAMVRRWFDCFPDLTEAVLNAFVHDQMVNHPVPAHLRHGKESFKAALRYVLSSAPDQTYTCHHTSVHGDVVAARTTWAGTFTGEYLGVQGNGQRFEVDQYHAFRVQDGKFIEHWAVRDDLALFRQTGVAPPA